MIAETELALVRALKDAGETGVLGYEYRVAETFPNELEQYLKEIATLRTPACWAVFMGMAEGADNSDEIGWYGRANFVVVVATQNLRNEEDTRHGDGSVPGTYQLAIDAVRILSRNGLSDAEGKDLGLVEPIMVSAFRPVARSPEMNRQGLSLMAIQCSCQLPLGHFDGGNIQDFETFNADWDVPALGNVSRDLPADNPDSQDTVELPQ